MIIDEIVFEPTNLLSLSNLAGARAQLGHGFVIDASEGDDARALLKAALSDWVDFCFTPHPKPFVIYADHDEFATFLANSRSNLNRVVTLLQKSRFTSVDYTLEF